MKVSKMLANITPVCNCGNYIAEGGTLETRDGSVGMTDKWWVACPDCGNTLGCAFEYPVVTSAEDLEKRGYKNESNSNA